MRFMSVSSIVFASLLAACSRGGSGISDAALAKQLVGHWSTASNDHLYFGAASSGTATGSYILVHPDGKEFDHHYKIDSTDGGKRTIETTLMMRRPLESRSMRSRSNTSTSESTITREETP